MVLENILEFMTGVTGVNFTEQLLVVFVLQLTVIFLVIIDMENRNFPTLRKIILLALVVFFPVPGALAYVITVMFLTEEEDEEKEGTGKNVRKTGGNVLQSYERKIEDKKFRCSCGKVFESRRGFANHKVKCENLGGYGEKSGKGDNGGSFVCSSCDKKFDTFRGLSEHKAKKH